MEGELLGDEVKVLGAIGSRNINTKLWKMMNTHYPSSYVDFRFKTGNLIHNVELLTSKLNEKGEGNQPQKS